MTIYPSRRKNIVYPQSHRRKLSYLTAPDGHNERYFAWLKYRRPKSFFGPTSLLNMHDIAAGYRQDHHGIRPPVVLDD